MDSSEIVGIGFVICGCARVSKGSGTVFVCRRGVLHNVVAGSEAGIEGRDSIKSWWPALV